jgi:hypothetical protein
MGIFDEFKSLALKARKKRRFARKKLSGSNPSCIRADGRTQSLLWIFGKSKKRLVKEFEVWLEQKRHLKFFKKHRIQTTGSTGIFLDRLKDLAVVRLYRRLEYNGLLGFTQANRRKR